MMSTRIAAALLLAVAIAGGYLAREARASITGAVWAGYALSFDGADDLVMVPSPQGLPSAALTVAVWALVREHRDFSRFVTNNWIGDGWILMADGQSRARFGVGIDNKEYVSAAPLTARRWHYICGVYDSQVVRVYVDGEGGSQVRASGAVLNAQGPIDIGGGEWNPLYGELDELRIWDHARSGQQILSDMTAFQIDTAGLVMHLAMDEGEGSRTLDASGWGNHGELGTAEKRRRPTWVLSTAPTSTPCLKGTGNLTLTTGALSHRVVLASAPKSGLVFSEDTVLDGAAPHQVASTIRFQVEDSEHCTAQAGDEQLAREDLEFRIADPDRPASASQRLCIDLIAGSSSHECGSLWTRSSTPLAGTCTARRLQQSFATLRAAPPAVSVVIPLYNQGHLLKETLDSVVNQSFSDWEVIISSDGSTDDSLRIAKQLIEAPVAQGYKMRVIDKPNGGLADARNAAIRVARGEWILPLDSDDLIHHSFLAKAYAAATQQQHPLQYNVVIADLQGFGDWEFSWSIPEFDEFDLLYTNMFHCSALFHKSLWDVAEGYKPSTLFGYEDWAFWIAAHYSSKAGAGIRPLTIRENLFFYRMRPDSMHQQLLEVQRFSVSSLRILFPTLYSFHSLLEAHERLMEDDARLMRAVQNKLNKFPLNPTIQFMAGLVEEGQGLRLMPSASASSSSPRSIVHLERAFSLYTAAADLAPQADWQPRFRKGLVLVFLNQADAALAEFQALMRDFQGIEVRAMRVCV